MPNLRQTFLLTAIVVAAIAQPFSGHAAEKEICVYIKPDGSVKQVNNLADVPRESRGDAQCFTAGQDKYLARPQDMQLSGSERREDILSAVGRIQLRWPRKVESLFGRTPLRAMTDAATTVSRALKRGSFPSSVQSLNIDWEVVFMDADLPETQVPSYLVANCRPGWMTPPANIYIVAQRVAGHCVPGEKPSGVADTQLTRVLIHEMGHALELFLLDGTNRGDRMRAEGFATWFETYAADFSSILNGREVEREIRMEAERAVRQSPSGFYFTGSSGDYARASMFFLAIEDKRGIGSLMDVYRRMREREQPFFPAVKEQLGWDERRINEEVVKLLKIR